MKVYEVDSKGRWREEGKLHSEPLTTVELRVMFQVTVAGKLVNGELVQHDRYRTDRSSVITQSPRKPHPDDIMKTTPKSQMDVFCTSVMDFQKKFNSAIGKFPALPSESLGALRVDLLKEELIELEDDGLKAENLVEVADALCDLQYVLSGAIISFGFQEIFQALFNEVHRSNMSKACRNKDVAVQTMLHYEKSEVESYMVEQTDGTYLVYRKNDDKLLKSVEYSEAYLEPIITKALPSGES